MPRKLIPRVPRICPHCRESFETTQWKIAHGGGLYCSQKCYHAANPATPPEVRFWRYVDTSGDCWVWTGAKHPLGYGQLNINQRPMPAHRLSWEIHNGPIPEGLIVRHECDNPPCVNPAHLLIGTMADNTHDMISRGRARGGRKQAQ